METICKVRAWLVQTDPLLLRYPSAITEQKRSWELLAQKFDQFQTSCNNSQQHATEYRSDDVTSIYIFQIMGYDVIFL